MEIKRYSETGKELLLADIVISLIHTGNKFVPKGGLKRETLGQKGVWVLVGKGKEKNMHASMLGSRWIWR